MAEDDHLARLHKEVADLEEHLKRFELGELQVSERVERGPWVDITKRYVEEKKRTLDVLKDLIKRRGFYEKDMGAKMHKEVDLGDGRTLDLSEQRGTLDIVVKTGGTSPTGASVIKLPTTSIPALIGALREFVK